VNVATLKSIALTPATASMAVNSTLSLQCLGKYSDLKTQHIEPFATWTSSDTTVATVNGIGVVKGVAIGGPVTITCAIGSVSATASITVEALTGITITPPSPSVAAGTSTNLAAIGTLTDSSTQDLTNTVEWTSSDTTVATVGSGSTSAGVVTGIAAGATTVTAAFSGQVAVTQVTVTAATLSSIAITPPDPIIALGASLQFVATGTFSDGSTENLLGQVTWTSSNNAVAIIDATGAISTTGKGTSTIMATLDGVSDTTTLTVN
jgi:trimeric autotransporter adhesin